MKVQDVMQRDVVTLGVEDSLDIAEDVMMLGRIRHLPVVDRDSRLVGLVTQRDLLKASVASVLELGQESERHWLASVPVRMVMARQLTTVKPTADVSTAVELMLQRKIGCIPVVEDGKLAGMLTESDCLGVLLNLLQVSTLEATAH
jgi:CBS domain-containing membrane protein